MNFFIYLSPRYHRINWLHCSRTQWQTMTMTPFTEPSRRHTTRFFIDDILVPKPKPLPREPAPPIISRPPFLDYATYAAASLAGPCPLLLTPPSLVNSYASFLSSIPEHPAFLLPSSRGKRVLSSFISRCDQRL